MFMMRLDSWRRSITVFGYDQDIKLGSCVALAIGTALDDLNPFSPSAFGSIASGAEGASSMEKCIISTVLSAMLPQEA